MKTLRPLFAFLILLPALLSADEAAPGLSAEAIVARYVETQGADSSMAFVEMKTVRPGLEVEERRFLGAYRRNEDGSSGYFIRMFRPREVEGVTVLSTEDAEGRIGHYLYLPTVGKARPMTSEAKAEPFLGSDFSFEDLLREVPSVNVYELLGDSTTQDREVYLVRATEVEGGSGAYLHRDLYIDKENFHLLQIDFYGLDGDLIKTLLAYDYDSPEIKGRTDRPRKAIMANTDTGSTTILTVLEGRIDENIPADLFTPERIESWEDYEIEEFIYQYGFSVLAETEAGD